MPKTLAALTYSPTPTLPTPLGPRNRTSLPLCGAPTNSERASAQTASLQMWMPSSEDPNALLDWSTYICSSSPSKAPSIPVRKVAESPHHVAVALVKRQLSKGLHHRSLN